MRRLLIAACLSSLALLSFDASVSEAVCSSSPYEQVIIADDFKDTGAADYYIGQLGYSPASNEELCRVDFNIVEAGQSCVAEVHQMSSGNLGTLLCTSTRVNPTTAGWNTFDFPPGCNLTGGGSVQYGVAITCWNSTGIYAQNGYVIAGNLAIWDASGNQVISYTSGNALSADIKYYAQVAAPLAITKSFGAASIPVNGSTSLSFTINNPDPEFADTGIAFTDTLPAGLVVATPNGLTGSCGAGTITATAGSGSVSLSGGTLAVSSSCTFSVNVTGTTAGVKNNSVTVNSVEGGTGNTSTASVTVAAAPTVTKSFGAASIPVNGSTSLSFTINNPNGVSVLTGIAFTDTLPAGLVVATPNGLAGSCDGGTITATAGSGSVSLSGATLPAGGSCTFSVNVTGTTAGAKNNSVTVSSVEGGISDPAGAPVTVDAPPAITKSFGAGSVPLSGTTSLSFTINNPNGVSALTGIAFTDTLPAGLVVSTPNGLAGSCGAGTITATAGSGSVSLSGATLPASGSCTFSVNVTGTTAGAKNNSVTVNSVEGGTGNTSTASVTVVAPLAITKSFGVGSILLNGSTSLSFTINNPNAASAQSGVAFTDTLPAGLVVSTPNGLVGSCGGGTITATAGSGSVSLSGATLPASGSCTFSVNVTGTTAGLKNNSVTVSSVEGGTGNTSTASVTVAAPAPPTVAKSFGAGSIPLNGSTSLSFTINNPNAASALTGVGFTDTLPAGLVVSTPNGLVGSCGGGTITATAGSGSVSLSGATLPASGSCTFSVNVTGTTAGLKNNSVTVNSVEGGTGNTSTASVTVAAAAPPTIAKFFGTGSIPLNGSTSLSFTINNPNAGAALTGIGFTDTLPAGLVVSTPNGLVGSCGGGTITATAGSGSVSLSGATLAGSASCTFSVNVTGTAYGNLTNTTGAVTSNEGGIGGTASAIISVTGTPAAVPTMTEWGMMIFMVLAGLGSLYYLRRQKRV